MNGILSKYISKLFVQQWTIGIAKASIKEIIDKKLFNPDIKWLKIEEKHKFYADPFLIKTSKDNFSILFEDYSFYDEYGKISVMDLDEHLKPQSSKIILDTNSHLSYPFIFKENNKTYVFPEAAQSGRLSCYEYIASDKELKFIKDVIELPLLDSTIFKYNNQYWLFGTMLGEDFDNKLYIFFSDSLLGPYTPHCNNPVKTGLAGTRPAGSIIEIDGVLYRPAQNSRYTYGGSIIINKINSLNDFIYSEEFYMSVSVNKKNKTNQGMHGMHTINVVDDIVVVDGTKWRFSPVTKLKQLKMKFLK